MKDSVILGNSFIGDRTIVGKNVVIGYPVEKALKYVAVKGEFTSEDYDRVSKGSRIGSDCIIRSGTVVYETVKISNNVRTGHNVLIREGSVIGKQTLIGSSVKLDGTVTLGKLVRIQSNAYLPHLTVVEDNVFIAPNVCFTNDPYPESKRLSGILVQKNATICANSTLIAGITIGENALVGAGSVVTKDVSANSVVWGNPACPRMSRNQFEKKKKDWNKK